MIIRREKRREKRRERLQRKMDKYKSELEAKHDGEEELKMKQLGYTRCKYCKHYMAPDKLLEAISSSVLKLANESKKYSSDELSSIPTLIMNVGKREPVKSEQLEKFKSVLQRAVVKCSNCNDVLIDHISIDFVLELQQKQIDLIFENRTAIEFMHDCV
jgi:transcription elongation factor Elf1